MVISPSITQALLDGLDKEIEEGVCTDVQTWLDLGCETEEDVRDWIYEDMP